MDEQIILLKDEFTSFTKQYEEASSIQDIPVLEKTIEAIKNSLVNLENKNNDIDKIYNDTAILLQNLYEEQLKIYEDKKAKEEAIKKAEEEKNDQDNSYEIISSETVNKPLNVTGVIKNSSMQSDDSTATTKQSILIENVSDNKENNPPKVSGIIKRSYDKDNQDKSINQNSNILIKSSGAIQKATGTITVK